MLNLYVMLNLFQHLYYRFRNKFGMTTHLLLTLPRPPRNI